MKHTIITSITLLALLLGSCTQSNTPVPQGISTSGPTMDSTETALSGTWYLQSKADTTRVDTVIYAASFVEYSTTAAYTEFKSSASPDIAELSDQYMDCNDGMILSSLGMHVGQGSALAYWYYNEAAQRLIVMGHNYQILELTGNTLTVKYTGSTTSTVYRYSK